jgi:hypothetical protein
MSIGTMRAIGAIVAVVLTWFVLMLFSGMIEPWMRSGVGYIGENFGVAGNVAFIVVGLSAAALFVLYRRRVDAAAQFARDRTIHVEQAKPWSYYAEMAALAVGPFIIGALLTISLRP